jgi:hypothetical protein
MEKDLTRQLLGGAMELRRFDSHLWMALLCFLLSSFPADPVLAASDTAVPGVEELATRSDLIFYGTCVSASSRWDDVSRIIVTDAVFRVDRYIKGNGPGEVLVTSPGGVLPERNLIMTVAGGAEYAPGEESLMFVTRSQNGDVSVYGLGRGKLTIQLDAAGNRRVRGQALDAFINSIISVLQNQRQRP